MDFNRKLFFNEELHKYTDDAGNPYVSCTTIIGKYKTPFDSRGIALACSRKRTSHYYGWPVEKILKYWDQLKNDRCEIGTVKHNYFETAVKNSNGYKRVSGIYINDRINTVAEVVKDPSYGILNIEYFIKTGISDLYPSIFNVMVDLVNKGYLIYAELGAYDYATLTSGLIDVFFYSPTKNKFAILDYKTNIDDLHKEAGYYAKDSNGNRTKDFITTKTMFTSPIGYLKQSKFNEYMIQVNIYAYLASLTGIECGALLLAHIRDELDSNGLEKVDWYVIPIDLNMSKILIEHHYYNHTERERNKQLKLVI